MTCVCGEDLDHVLSIGGGRLTLACNNPDCDEITTLVITDAGRMALAQHDRSRNDS